jgi:ubiquitin carboxyl-terminal hydrolase 25/28
MSEPEMGLDEAYALFSISAISDRKAVDLSVLESTVVVDSSGDVEKLRKAYKLIEQDQRQNYNNAAEKPREPGARINDIPLDTWPVGCRNIGNTCYLNSVLQFLFTIKPLRDLILKYEDHLQDPSAAALEGKKVGRTIVTAERVATAQRFVRELRDLFKWMIEASTDNVQPTIDLAALALCKTDSPEVDQKVPEAETSGTNGLGAIDGMPVNGPMAAPTAAPTANENLIFTPADSVMGDDNDDAKSDTSMQAMNGDESKGTEPDADDKPVPPTRPPPIPPRPDTQTKTKLEHIGDSARQQDAAEVLGNIMDLLSCAIRGNEDVLRDGEQNDLIKSLFFSDVTIVRNTAKGAENTSELRNHYLISAGGRDRHLYAALDDDFGLNELEGGETKYEYVAKAAPIQIINVRRLQFDKEKKRQVRDQAQLGLDDTLYLDRYLESTNSLSGEQLLQLRKAQWDRQQELHRLEGRRKDLQTPELEGMDLADSVEETAMLTQNFLAEIEQQMNSSLPTPPAELPGVLHDKAKQLKEELTNINDSMTQLESEIDSVFKDCRDHSYRLHSIFIHRGGTQAGHYLIYIYDFQNKMWREYNDETVKQADRSDIFKLGAGSLASGSTGIVYIREDLVDTLTEAVQRQPDMTSASTNVPIDAPTGAPTRSPTETADIEMKDLEASTPLQPIDYDNIEVIDGVEKP